jgi:hypothetical protein
VVFYQFDMIASMEPRIKNSIITYQLPQLVVLTGIMGLAVSLVFIIVAILLSEGSLVIRVLFILISGVALLSGIRALRTGMADLNSPLIELTTFIEKIEKYVAHKPAAHRNGYVFFASEITLKNEQTFIVSNSIAHKLHTGNQVKIWYTPNLHYLKYIQTLHH